jgi:DNA polymerase-3 subunit gamma/tau
VSRAVAAPEPPAWIDAVPDESTTTEARAGAEANTALRSAERVNAASIASVRVPVLQPTELGQRWADLVMRLNQEGSIAALVRELAMQAEWIAEESDRATPRWQLRVERESLRASALREKLQAAVAAGQGRAIELELVDGVALDSPALRDAAARARAQQQAEQTMTADPVVRELMAQFKTARIVPGSIKPVQRNPSP